MPERVARGPLLVALEPDQVGVEAVPRCAPLVLRDERDRLDRQRPLALVALGEGRGEALDEGDERGDALDSRLRVADADLDRAEPGVRAEVPPDVRVVGEGVRPDSALDERLEVAERGEGRRQPAAREGVEDLDPRRGEAGVAAVPEGRVGREREQLRQPGAERIRDPDRLVAGAHADVDVEAEDQLALGDPLHLLEQADVARRVGDVLVLVARERVRARGGDQRPALGGRVAEPGAKLARLLDRLGRVAADARRHLEHRLEELRLDPLVPGRLGHLVEARDELVALGREELELLLDPDAEGRAAPEVRVHRGRQPSRRC